MRILEETVKPYHTPIIHTRQRVHIPSSWFGRRSGGYSQVVRTVKATGIVTVVEYTLPVEKAYGVTRHGNEEILVIQSSAGCWQAIDRRKRP